MNKRRDSTRVIYEILSLAKNGCSKTHIVYQANLNFRLAEHYLHFLVDKELVVFAPTTEGVLEYRITEKGSRFLHFLSKVEMELENLPKVPLASHGHTSLSYSADEERTGAEIN